jgi:hypothetical protein
MTVGSKKRVAKPLLIWLFDFMSTAFNANCSGHLRAYVPAAVAIARCQVHRSMKRSNLRKWQTSWLVLTEALEPRPTVAYGKSKLAGRKLTTNLTASARCHGNLFGEARMMLSIEKAPFLLAGVQPRRNLL